MNTYELTLVLRGSQDDAKRKAVLDRVSKLITSSEGVITQDDKGMRRALAYAINHEKEGVYYFLTVDLDPDKTNPLARLLENDDDILRQLIVRVEKSEEKNKAKEVKTEAKPEVKEPKKAVKKKVTKAKIKKAK